MNGTSSGNGETQSVAQDQAEAQSSRSGQEQYADSTRRPKSKSDDAFDVGAWLLQGLAGLSTELCHSDLGLPEEFWVHAYAARREALLAARALVDATMENCANAERKSVPKKKKPPQRGQVSIDFG